MKRATADIAGTLFLQVGHVLPNDRNNVDGRFQLLDEVHRALLSLRAYRLSCNSTPWTFDKRSFQPVSEIFA